MKSPPVAAVLKLFTERPDVVAKPTIVMTLTPTSAIVRAAAANMHDTTISFSTITYAPGARSGAIDGWKQLVGEAEKRGSGVCQVLEEQGSRTTRILEVGNSKGLVSEGLGVGSGNVEEAVELKAVEGYWWKQKGHRAKLS